MAYGTESGFEAYTEARGYTVPSGDVPAAMFRGSAYIDAVFGMRFSGYPTGGIEQGRQWPRTDATDAYGNAISSSAIPTAVINASYEAALLELQVPGSLTVTFDPAKRVKRQKVDTIEREFFEPGKGSFWSPNAPVNSLIEGMLAGLIGTANPYPTVLVV